MIAVREDDLPSGAAFALAHQGDTMVLMCRRGLLSERERAELEAIGNLRERILAERPAPMPPLALIS